MERNGYTLIPNDLLDAEYLTTAEREVLWMLIRHNGPRGVFPSVSLLARKTRLSERTVRRAIERLEKRGLIKVERARGNRNRYHLTFDRTLEVPRSNVPGSDENPGQIDGGTPVHLTADPSTFDRRVRSNVPPTNTKYKYKRQIHTKGTNIESVQEGKRIPTWQEEEDKPVDPKELERVFKEKPWLKEWYDRMLKLIREREKDERLRREWVKAEEVAQEAHRLLQKLYDDPVPPKDEEFYRKRKEEIRRQYRELTQQVS